MSALEEILSEIRRIRIAVERQTALNEVLVADVKDVKRGTYMSSRGDEAKNQD
jgi:hypothetical protein